MHLEENERNFTEKKGDGIPCVIIFPCITKSNDPRSVFFTFLKLCKSYQIAQRITEN